MTEENKAYIRPKFEKKEEKVEKTPQVKITPEAGSKGFFIYINL